MCICIGNMTEGGDGECKGGECCEWHDGSERQGRAAMEC